MNTAPEHKNNVTVHLTITSDRDISGLADAIGLQPAQRWRAGDLIDGSVRRYERNGWRLSSPGTAPDVESGVDQLFNVLSVRWSEICKIDGDLRRELSIVVYANEYVPSIALRVDQVQRVSELGASIDVDLYCLMQAEGSGQG
jgi:hypothetical protein